MSEKEDQVVQDTRGWICDFVIELGLCPFAAKVFNQEQIDYCVLHETERVEIVESVIQYIPTLLDSNHDTGVLILSEGLADFFDYLAVLDEVQTRLEKGGYEGVVQVASFHPNYQFAGADEDDAANYSNRSPFPIFHILREASLTAAIDSHPDVGGVTDRNIDLLRKLGPEYLKNSLRAIGRLV